MVKVKGGVRVLAAEVIGDCVVFEFCIVDCPEIAEAHHDFDACLTFLLQRF